MPYFSDEEGEWMVRTARRVLEHFYMTNEIKYFNPPTAKLRDNFGVFTTIKTYPDLQLRGCIGYPEPIKPLYIALAETAVLAATRDPRFPPMDHGELDHVVIEVSALTPPKRVDVSKDELPQFIEVGKHGLIIRNGPYSGLLLPQVPVEEGWNAIEFLEYTSIKAGLPRDAWTWPDTEVYTFTAEVFSEIAPKSSVKRVM